jgi:hypothetical protein
MEHGRVKKASKLARVVEGSTHLEATSQKAFLALTIYMTTGESLLGAQMGID